MPRPRRALVPSSPLGIRAATPTACFNLQICIYDEPRRRPVQAPKHCEQYITIVPESDSDAYIIDKVVTPFGASVEDRAVRRVLNYVIGWPDRPYAQQLVPCNKILDYVSPRTLEDYEYAVTLEQHAEKEAASAVKASGRSSQAKRRRQSPTIDIDREISVERFSAINTEIKDEPAKSLSGPRGPGKKQSRKPQPETTQATMAPTKPAPPSERADHLIVQNIPSAIISGDRRTGFSLKLKRPFEQVLEQTNTESSMDEGDLDVVGSGLVTSDTQYTQEDKEDIFNVKSYVAQHTIERGLQATGCSFEQRTEWDYSARTAAPKNTPVLPPRVVGMSYSPRAENQASLTGQFTADSKPKTKEQKMASDILEQRPTEGEEEDSDLYEVDRLEDDTFYVVDEAVDGEGGEERRPVGEVIRFFLVRWKGNWPPDQNPTWEPAENLPPKMVRQYLKKAYGKNPSKSQTNDMESGSLF